MDGGIEALAPQACTELAPAKKKKQKEIASGTTARRPPPYREAILGRKQELGQEATPGRRNFFRRSIRSKPKPWLLFALAMRFRIVFVRRLSHEP
jgi:hypothetical protein